MDCDVIFIVNAILEKGKTHQALNPARACTFYVCEFKLWLGHSKLPLRAVGLS